MDLLDLAAFNAVAAHGGIAAASRVTGTPKATLSRRVRALEAGLGLRLLERGPSVRLTEDGHALRDRTASLLDGLAEAADDIGGRSGPRGRLRISVPVLFAQTFGGRLAAAFTAAYPEVTLDIEVADRFVDLVADGFDLALRVNPDPDSTLVGRCVLSGDYVIAAHPAVTRPASGSEIRAVMLSHEPDEENWRIAGTEAPITFRPRPAIRCSSMLLVLDAVLAGAGVAVLPRYLVTGALDSGALVAWGTLADRRVEVWVLHTSRRLTSPKVTAFIHMLCATVDSWSLPHA